MHRFTCCAVIVLVVNVLLPASDALSTEMTKNLKVLVSSNDFAESGIKILEEQYMQQLNLYSSCNISFTVVKTRYFGFGEEGLNDNMQELMNLIPGCSALVWVSHHQITKELLDKAGPQLKIVSTASAGYNNCNVAELKARGIKLSNTPNVLSAAVAEIAVALMIAAARRFPENLDQVRRGEWDGIGFQNVLGQDLRGSTVGIIGFGGIGQASAKRLVGFEVAKFLYSGHREKPEAKEFNAQFVPQDSLLNQSDFILVAAPLTDETRHMINKTSLAKMKKNAIIVNVGRGDLINQDDLYDALKNKQIYGAGLDVTTPEPLPKDHKLLTLPNFFLLPHIGSATIRTRNDMAELAARNVVNALCEKPLITPVLP